MAEFLSKSKTKTALGFIALISSVIGITVGLPPLWYTYTCSNSGIQCDRSLLGPEISEIRSEAILDLRTSGVDVQSITFTEIKPRFSSPKVVVAAQTQNGDATLGVFNFSLKDVVEVGKFPDYEKYVLVVPAVGTHSFYKYYDFHIFDVSQPFYYSFLRMECRSNKSKDAPLSMKNFRWGQSNGQMPESDTLSFDLISECSSVKFNDVWRVNFKNEYTTSDRIEISFDEELLASNIKAINAEQSFLDIKSRIDGLKTEHHECLKEIDNEIIGRFTKICRTTQYPLIDMNMTDSVSLFSFVGLDNSQQIIIHNINCSSYSAISNITREGTGYVICPKNISLDDGGELELHFAKLGWPRITPIRFSSKDYQFKISEPEIGGVFRKVSFDVYSSADVVEINSKQFKLSSAEQVDAGSQINAPYRGRYILEQSTTGAALDLVLIK